MVRCGLAIALMVATAAGCSSDSITGDSASTAGSSSLDRSITGTTTPVVDDSALGVSPTVVTSDDVVTSGDVVPAGGSASNTGVSAPPQPPASSRPPATATDGSTIGSSAGPEVPATVNAVPSPATAAPGVAATTVDPSFAPSSASGSPASGIRVVSGSADLGSVIQQRTPLLLHTFDAAEPTDVTIVVTHPGEGGPVAADGNRVTFSFQMYAWGSDENYDGTPPGQPRTVVLGTDDLASALYAALIGASPGEERVVTYPIGEAGIPDFVPDDVAYYLIISIESIAA